MLPAEEKMWSRESPFFHTGVLVIDLIAALLIVGYVVAALVDLIRGGSVTQARLIVAEGAVFGLSFKLAATLLKTLELHSWDQILMFATVFVLRTILKQLFVWEKQQVQRNGVARQW
jgi:uncharacterized membrane protein